MFLEEIKPYEERIRLAQQGKGRIKPDILKEIREIYDEYVKDPRLNTKTDIGCGNCVRHMMNQLVGKINREQEVWRETNVSKEFKVVSEHMTFPKVVKVKLKRKELPSTPENVEELKDTCKYYGIKYHHKAGVKKLTQLINDYLNEGE